MSSLWADERLYYPLEVELYTPAHHFEGDKEDPRFRTKPQIALELVEAAVEEGGIPFSPTATLPVNCGRLLLQSTEEAHLAAQKHRSGGGDQLAIIERWPDALGELHARIAHRFLRPEVGERARRYLAGLLGRVGRKNGWQLAEQMGETGPQGAQRFLNAASCWDADAVRNDLRKYVVEHLGEEETGVLVVDETGFLKKGEKSVGVARQYTGTAGRIENAQVGVFLAYASEKGAAFVDRTLYLPREEWVDDPVRRAEAGVPEGAHFATKGELAREMPGRAFEAGVPARWVVADTVYGTARGLRGWLEERGCSYVLAVPATKGVHHEGRQRQARSLAEDLPDDAWARASAGAGSKGERLYDWALVSLPESEAPGAGRWLLVRRSIGDPTEFAYYLAYGPKGTPAEELVRVAGRRWATEVCQPQYTFRHGLSYHRSRRAIRAARVGGETRSRPRIRKKGRPEKMSRGAAPPRP